MSGEFRTYDDVPYIGRIHFPSHPSVLAVVARLFGVPVVLPHQGADVLEVGCADGANIITMAYHMPESRFVGIDGSASQIEVGRKVIADLGLKNITLHAMDLREITDALGQFDYIIAHGIFSWIADDARRALLQTCRANLKDEGVAYISYNCYPGWHLYEQLRGIMRFHVRGMSSVQEEIEQARAVMRFIGSAIIDTDSPRADFFRAVLPDVLKMSDDYIYHEYLEANNQPMYFHEFMGMAMEYGLQYLGESSFHAMMSDNYPEEVRDTLDRISHNILELEQYMDFLRNRRFRCTLLCKAERTVERAVTLEPLVDFWIGFGFKCDEEDPDLHAEGNLQFTFPGDEETAVVVQTPLHKAALLHLSRVTPATVPFRALARHCADVLGVPLDNALATELAELVMRLFSQSFAEVLAFQPPLTSTVTERPRASRLARYQAHHCRILSSQRHEMVQLSDSQGREVVARLDGQHTIDDIVDELLPLIPEDNLAQLDDPRGALRESVELILRRMARQGVLIPDDAVDG